MEADTWSVTADAGWSEVPADAGWSVVQADAGWSVVQADAGLSVVQADAGETEIPAPSPPPEMVVCGICQMMLQILLSCRNISDVPNIRGTFGA